METRTLAPLLPPQSDGTKSVNHIQPRYLIGIFLNSPISRHIGALQRVGLVSQFPSLTLVVHQHKSHAHHDLGLRTYIVLSGLLSMGCIWLPLTWSRHKLTSYLALKNCQLAGFAYMLASLSFPLNSIHPPSFYALLCAPGD